MLVLSSKDQENLITMENAIDAVGIALSEYSYERAVSPVRISLPVLKGNGTSLFMPSLVEEANSLGIKFVSVFPDNKVNGKKTIYGLMILADVRTGEPLAMMEASYLTVLRTGAASGLATKHLSRENAKTLTIIGTGAQSSGLIEAILAVRQIEEIRLVNRNEFKAQELAKEVIVKYGNHLNVNVFIDPDKAVQGSDIVVTATNSSTPVFSGETIGQGVHVNAIGSFRPTMQELPSLLLARAEKVVVEAREAALEETGDLIIPIEQGFFTPDKIFAELGEIASGERIGREHEDEITVFKSVGLAAMDVVVAKTLYDRAVEMGIGQKVSI